MEALRGDRTSPSAAIDPSEWTGVDRDRPSLGNGPRFAQVLAGDGPEPAAPIPNRGGQAISELRQTVTIVDESGTMRETKTARPTLRDLADDTFSSERRIDALIEAGRHGKTFSASELLALQVDVFRYSQTIEIISRGTDRLIGGIKQMIGTQV